MNTNDHHTLTERLGLDGLRLTRRGRVVIGLFAVFLASPALGFGASAVASQPTHGIEVTVHTVAPGQTLWQLASSIAEPGEDLRDVVWEIRQVNDLPSSQIHVGQTILLPID
ncbi:MAG: LysM peptidoglycan-binding domain-containing protein [Cellulomonadaceae bacterium]|jgi:hypothetical protein|nr:LysM peptidoglycan-binding domain-containing protein [Cellulomonadaceae bacterium]